MRCAGVVLYTKFASSADMNTSEAIITTGSARTAEPTGNVPTIASPDISAAESRDMAVRRPDADITGRQGAF